MTSPALPSSVLPDRGGDTRTGRLLALGLLWVLLLGAWPAAAGETPNVLVSVKPIHSLVAGIMEGVADPGLIATERSPLELEITPQWRDRLAAADLIIWVGPELEPALAGVLRDPAMQPRALELRWSCSPSSGSSSCPRAAATAVAIPTCGWTPGTC